MAPLFSKDERAFMASCDFETKSYVEVQRRFRLNFPNAQRNPSKHCISYNCSKFRNHGKVTNRFKDGSGRRRSVRTRRNIDAVERALQRNPRMSARRNTLAMNHSSFNRITRLDLQMYPYRIQVRHALQQHDLQRRLTYCQWLINRPDRMLRESVVVDEANFHLNGTVTTSNVRCYARRDNPPRDFVYDRPNDRRKVVVFMGISGGNHIIGPVFYDGNINGQLYLDTINQVVAPRLAQLYGQQRNGTIPRVWFFQDGASIHRTRAVHDRLEELFPNRVVGLGHNVPWPPRSPDLTAADFFLWGYLKQQVYGTGVPPRNLPDLRDRIMDATRALRRTRMCSRAVCSMRRRAERCIAKNGAQVEGRAGRD